MKLNHLIAKTLSELSSKTKFKRKAVLRVSLNNLIQQKQNIRKRSLSESSSNCSVSGNYKSKAKGRGIELEEIRPYNFSDDIRDIDWRVTARKENVYTKIYNQEKDIDVYVLLDFSASMMFGSMRQLKSVAASKVLACIAWQANANSDRFGAIVNDGMDCFSFKSNNSVNSILSVFNKLVKISNRKVDNKEFENKIEFIKTLDIAKSVIKSGSIVYIVSDFMNFDDNTKKYISYIAKSNNVNLINIYDDIERQSPKSNQYRAHIGDEDITFDTSSKSFKTEYKNHFEAKMSDIHSFCNKFRCKYHEVNNNTPIEEQLGFLR